MYFYEYIHSTTLSLALQPAYDMYTLLYVVAHSIHIFASVMLVFLVGFICSRILYNKNSKGGNIKTQRTIETNLRPRCLYDDNHAKL